MAGQHNAAEADCAAVGLRNMPAVKRTFLKLLSFLCLFLCIGMLGLWSRSHRLWDAAFWCPKDRDELAVRSARGRVEFRLTFDQHARFPRHLWLGYGRASPPVKPMTSSSTSSVPYTDLLIGGSSLDDLFWGDDLFNRARLLNCGGVAIDRATWWNPAKSQKRFWALTVPHWLLATLLAIPPAVSLARAMRRFRRRRAGLCVCCGYDLRASPERCPECGVIRTATAPPVRP